MRDDGAPAGRAVHASAVAIGGRALLIFGRSGAGKSRLAFALTRASSEAREIELVGDDRVLLRLALGRGAAEIEVRPHPRIAGFIERRGLGLVSIAHRDHAIVAASVRLGEGGATEFDSALQNYPMMPLVFPTGDACDAEAVLAWWDRAVTRPSQHTAPRKRVADSRAAAKEWNW